MGQVGPHEIISFRKWKINPQIDRVNKYATLIPILDELNNVGDISG